MQISIIFLITFSILCFILLKFKRWCDAKNSKTRVRELKSLAIDAQINPHFLNNTINNLQQVLLSKNHEEANDYLIKFSEMIRYALKMNTVDSISLDEEIKYLEAYLLLTNMRLNQQLNYSIEVIDDLKINLIKIPPLVIQPIIENAITHGLKPKKGEKTLKLLFKIANDQLIVEIIDNGIGRKAARINQINSIIRTDINSSNIFKKRLKLNNNLYSSAISLIIKDLTPENFTSYGTKVLIKMNVLNQLTNKKY